MKYPEARKQFIETWGMLGSQWGINKTIAQIQALLLISPDPLSTDAIMDALTISRGNANMSLRQLAEWGIVYKKTIPGDRKEYFAAEKDVWKWSVKIGKVRKKKELDPVLDLLREIAGGKPDQKSAEETEFYRQIKDLDVFTHQVSRLIDKLLLSPHGEFLLKLIKTFAR